MTIWSPDLSGVRGPLYRAIAGELAQAIKSGELAAGSRLPTQRELALHLQVSVQTVSQAYAEVERLGLVSGEVGRGTFVLASKATAREPGRVRRGEPLIDLSINQPAYDDLHGERLAAGLEALAKRRDISALVAVRPIAGLDEHRRAGTMWVRRRGVETTPDRVVVTNGVSHGVLVALAALTRPGDRILTEALTDHGTIGVASLLGLRLGGLELDPEGILPEAFEKACEGGDVKVLCITPTLNNPTVAVMSEDRRRRIAEIARRHQVAVIENDIYGELVADGPPALMAYLPEFVCYVTGFSKAVLAGLRTGYVVAPPRLIQPLVRRVRITSWMATPLVADLAREWIEDGTASELVSWQRRALAGRYQVVRRILGDFDVTMHPGAPHAWLNLPGRWRAEAFVAEARLENVAITPADPFAVDRAAAPQAVRISVGAAADLEELAQGLEALAHLLRREPEPFYVSL